jgi:hypothetical protein
MKREREREREDTYIYIYIYIYIFIRLQILSTGSVKNTRFICSVFPAILEDRDEDTSARSVSRVSQERWDSTVRETNDGKG